MLRFPATDDSRETIDPAPAPFHPREIDRLASLCGLYLDVVEAEPLFDEIARQAAAVCEAPFATVTIVREHEQAFLGNNGLDGAGSDRDEAICAYTILEREALIVEDLRRDARFADFSIVTGPPFMRFYAGVPLFDGRGLPLGTVCVLDTEPREISAGPMFALARLAVKAGVMLEARRLVADLLGPSPHPVALHKALRRMDHVMEPLFRRSKNFRHTDR